MKADKYWTIIQQVWTKEGSQRMLSKAVKTGICAVSIAVTGVALDVSAARKDYIAKVSKVLVHDSDFGGCMAFTDPGPESAIAACKSGWVTMDCVAAFPGSTKSGSQTKLAAAQLAYATGQNLGVQIIDNYSVNGVEGGTGYCYATKMTNR